MKIPLSAYPIDDGILIYRNGNVDKIDYPFRPFVLARKDKVLNLFGKEETWRKVPEDEDLKYLKLDFSNVKEFNEFRKRQSKNSSNILMNSFMEQIYICSPEFFFKYPHTNNLRLMFFDIEVASKGDGLFPRPSNNEILCIGYSIWEYFDNGSKRKIWQDICKGFDVKSMSDKPVIDSFLDAIKKYDPDIIAGYFSSEFDLPYVIERAKIVKSDITKLCRGGREPVLGDKENKIRLPGRIHFDIFESNIGVKKDQTLFGIKSRKLKELARWYNVKRTKLVNNAWVEDKMEDIEIPEHMEDLLKLFRENPSRLYAYQDDDIYRTEGIGHVYLRTAIILAEIMGVTLESVIEGYSSSVPKLCIAREMHNLKLINTETNFHKYNIQNGSIAKISGKLKYEGAIGGLYKNGYIPYTQKLDFKSQYPSAIQTWNLGPDTTKLISIEPYTGKYNCTQEGTFNWYRIPTTFDDGKFSYDFIVRVRNDKDGFLKKYISDLKQERKKINQELKSAQGDEKIALNSQQHAIKIKLNSTYGFLGLKSTIYGDMISAVMVTAMCRWCTMKLLQRNKDVICEVDTDGIIVDKHLSVEEENTWIDKEIKEKFKLKENFMTLDLEDEGNRAYFYLKKNYVIEKNGDFIIHGSSLKGSKSSKVVDRAINLGIQYIFNNKPIEEVFREAYDFNGLKLEDFAERIKLSKDTVEYDDQFDFRIFLVKQVEAKTGRVITKGTQMNYLVTKDKLPYEEFRQYYRGGKNYTYTGYVSKVEELDINYYIEQVDKALAKFGISKTEYIKINMFDTGVPNKKPIDQAEELDTIYIGEL
jgi:DNA polymerase I